MKSKEILEKYIKFFQDRGHKLIPNVPVVPKGDSTLLFVNSGMFPLVPYLTGEPHPLGKRLVNIQRCVRFFEEIGHIGDTNRHTTAFHMLGNWGLNDYFKEEQLAWVFEFAIEELKLDPKRIYATVFKGDKSAPKDVESIEIIKKLYKKYGIKDAKEDEKIFALGKDNWWERANAPGELGGPSSEIFYYIGNNGKDGTGLGLNLEELEDSFLEFGNSVFIEYKMNKAGNWDKIKQRNIDFGGGLERMALIMQQKTDIFETDNFWPIIEEIQQITGLKYGEDKKDTKAMRIIADHMRTSIFLVMDGVVPSNKDQGYILRRLLRRMVRFGKMIGIEKDISVRIVKTVTDMWSWLYPELPKKQKNIELLFAEEEEKFRETLKRVGGKIDKYLSRVDYKEAPVDKLAEASFDLYQSVGYPHEMFIDDLKERGRTADEEVFMNAYQKVFKAHQAKSRKGAEKLFKGGLADHSRETVRYHTATHLIHRGLVDQLGKHVSQEGSNITGERFRFDFKHDEKLTDEQIKSIETEINNAIMKKLPVKFKMMPTEEAKKSGALHFFDEKYPEKVKVYYIGENLENAYSKEFCGGPHVKNTSELEPIEIFRQESVGKGVRRLYARFKK